jgi:amino acid adenylation domain-containing protein
MWLINQLEPDTASSYMTDGARRIEGALDVEALLRSLQTMVERHHVLRTVIRLIDGVPMQIVVEDVKLDLPTIDLSAVPEAEREAELLRTAQQAAQQPLDLSSDINFRPVLIRLGPNDHVLLTLIHHIASDGWSRRIFFRELFVLYEAYAAGKPDPLEPLPLQYADYAAWQRQRYEGERLEKELSWWREHLAGVPTSLDLPVARARPARQSHAGARERFTVSEPAHKALKELSRSHRSTLFMLGAAALNTLLSRYSGQEDIVIGTVMANRNYLEIEGSIGYFANTLALRTDLSGDPTFTELLERVRNSFLEAYTHQETPFSQVVAATDPHRQLSHSPLFQVLYVLQEAMPKRDEEYAGLKVSRPQIDLGYAKFDLTVAMGEDRQGLLGAFEYATDLFDAGSVTAMQGHFTRILEAVAAEPNTRLSRLPMLSAEERTGLISWSSKPKTTQKASLHELFSKRAAQTPDAPAAIHEESSLSYRELDERSNQLARHLEHAGVRPGDRVAVYLQRSLTVPVSLLAILKAGAVCLPLDTKYPLDRLRYILRETQPRALLSDRTLTRLPGTQAAIYPETEWHEIEKQSAEAPEVTVAPDDPAYLIYTSGSTGDPKGVVLTHRGLANHAVAAAELYGLRSDDRVLQFASIGSDIALEELFPSWHAGAVVVIRSEDTPIGGPGFHEWLTHQRITVLDLPTAFWHEWVSDLSAHGERVPADVRTLILGGETASAEIYKKWLQIGGTDVRSFNTYGPTEASVIVTAYEMPTVVDDVPAELPIGRPIKNVEAYVLDAALDLAPIGVPGELYIGGIGVARGYHNDPELTAKGFVRNRFSPTPGTKLYRSGDRATWLPDGNLRFLGRIDDQLKIRGFRIEPHEIEAALARHPAVRNSVVVAVEDNADSRRLVAYVEPTDPEDVPSEMEFRAQLSTSLPAYMIPSTFVTVETIPLTANGKVDKQALPSPTGSLDKREVVAPRTEKEQQLAYMWQEVLSLDEAPGVLDDFFSLGGHSLLVVRLFASIEREFGVRLPLTMMIANPTIESLAVALGDSKPLAAKSSSSDDVETSPPTGAARSSTIVPLRNTGKGLPLVVVGTKEGEALMYRDLIRHLGNDHPIYALQPHALDPTIPPYTRIERVAEDYVRDLLDFPPAPNFAIVGYCWSGLVAYEVARQLRERGSQPPVLVAAIDSLYAKPWSRFELERRKFADFARRDFSGKIAWLSKRIFGVAAKIRVKRGWIVHDVLRTKGLPTRPLTLNEAGDLAWRHYVRNAQPSDVEMTFFHAAEEGRDGRYPIAWFRSLAQAGFAVEEIETPGIRHDNVMYDPFARDVARRLGETMRAVTDHAAAPDLLEQDTAAAS